MFSLSRFKDHILESVVSVGSYYKPVIPTERYEVFTEEELEILKSSIKIETILNDGSEILAQVNSNGTIDKEFFNQELYEILSEK